MLTIKVSSRNRNRMALRTSDCQTKFDRRSPVGSRTCCNYGCSSTGRAQRAGHGGCNRLAFRDSGLVPERRGPWVRYQGSQQGSQQVEAIGRGCLPNPLCARLDLDPVKLWFQGTREDFSHNLWVQFQWMLLSRWDSIPKSPKGSNNGLCMMMQQNLPSPFYGFEHVLSKWLDPSFHDLLWVSDIPCVACFYCTCHVPWLHTFPPWIFCHTCQCTPKYIMVCPDICWVHIPICTASIVRDDFTIYICSF